MKLSVEIEILKPKEAVWIAITDIKNSPNMISSIISLEILNQPVKGLVDLKWQETREMFGKQASEIMWITDAVENEFYYTRAESHGSAYITKMMIEGSGDNSVLSMTFNAVPQSFFVKIISACMSIFIKKMMLKALTQDLEDIKKFVESN